jgi:[ribosomal protein S18]-alanine N-acetyltransferase
VTRRIVPLPPGLALPLAAMQGACFPEDPWDAAALDRILALSGVFGYLACESDGPVGFILARDLGEEAEVLTFGVLPEARRQGIGRALLDTLLAAARRRRLGSAVLEVAADNAAARRLYAACGFIQAGRRPRYYRRPGGTVDGLIMRRGLASGSDA